MNILIASSEAVPFAKTGGLADVSGALPVALQKLGVGVSLFLPAYRSAFQSGQPIEDTGIEFDVPVGNKIIVGRFLKSTLPGSDVPVYLVDQKHYFDRPGLYNENGRDYEDNCERFVFFCRAVIEGIRLLDIPVDVVHANDWQTGLIPALLHAEYQSADRYRSITTLYTIHNMAYQGWFWHWDMLLTGLDWKYYNWQQMECHGQLNLLKTGIIFSHSVSTVSPTYAEEIQTAPLGCGLDGVLRDRADVLTGILNGIDQESWNPEKDPLLFQNFSIENWQAGKRANKLALQEDVGLTVAPDQPLIGSVGRLVDQKGWDLILQILPQWLETESAQWVILGTGDANIEQRLQRLADQHPGKLSLQRAFSEQMARRIEAASDVFLMPSQYEPCGLNQFYSLRYGTVPVVRSTGGLADSIRDLHDADQDHPANGFTFEAWDAEALNKTLERAVGTYRNQPDVWRLLVETGMKQDWSWEKSAEKYIKLYQQTIARRNMIQ